MTGGEGRWRPYPAYCDSGVGWLGEIPAHWETVRLKHAASHVVDCPHATPIYDANGEYHVIRTADVSSGRLDWSNTLRVSDDQYRLRIERLRPLAGDIVYSREGERFGMAALVPAEVDTCLGQRMMHFRTRPEMAPAFLMWQLNSDTVYTQALLDVTGATSPHVNVGAIRNFWLVQPPFEEQVTISDCLGRATAQFDMLSAKVRAAIDKLREYRAALISAAVTGKIDVRASA